MISSISTRHAQYLLYLFYLISQFSEGTIIKPSTEIPTTINEILKTTNLTQVKSILNGSRRIMSGNEAGDKRPYMVYLKLPTTNPKYKEYKRWLCGGVIIHEEYVLTSAACIEDVKNFYIVSGTYKHSEEDDRFSNPCIKNGAKKAIWKCVPRNYVFDGHENDNIRWMNNDIAVVKVEDEFDFYRRVRGCDFTPKPICYNNRSADLEQPGNLGTIAGWGSTDKYNDWVNSRRDAVTRQNLLETSVTIISKSRCKARWGSRYKSIIDNYMICSADSAGTMSEICEEKYVDCTDVTYDSQEETRRVVDPSKLIVHSGHQNSSSRRFLIGGFCENDHGGPLVIGEGVESVVIGIISACLVKEKSNKCYGPFLYTSIFRNKALIDCAVYKDVAPNCNKLFRASETHHETDLSWLDHPDGPAKNELKIRRNIKEKNNTRAANATDRQKNYISISHDQGIEYEGVTLTSYKKETESDDLEAVNNTKT